jgi:CBS-domain-containing membrane protein
VPAGDLMRMMRTDVVTVGQSATMAELAALTGDRGVHSMPIPCRGRLAGAVRSARAVRALLTLSAEAEAAPAAAP